jgi:hypothetical protein
MLEQSSSMLLFNKISNFVIQFIDEREREREREIKNERE